MTISARAFPAAVQLAWPLAPFELRLGQSEVHVWCAWLSDFHDALSRFDAVLSADERTRASKFHLARDCDQFIARRGILRELLAHYLHQDAATIEFSADCFGKPYLSGPGGGRLHFNTSHSGALAVYALTKVSPVGVDVERLREVPNMDAIASRFLAPEANRVAALPAERRLEEFFTCWTGTEAFLKATGGIGADLDLQRKVPSPLSSDWRLHPLLPAPGYVGALAYRHDEARVSLWRVSGATVAARAITV